MKVYIIAGSKTSKKPRFCLTGKWIDNGENPAGLECSSILRAKRYSNMEEIETDPMTHTPGFWGVNEVYSYEEDEIATLEEETRQEIRKSQELVEKMCREFEDKNMA